MKKDRILGYAFSTSSRAYKKVVNEEMERFDLTVTQCGVLRILKYVKEASQAEIAELYASDRATIGSVIQKLQEKDYLEKVVSTTDRRAFMVRLTPKAESIADEIEEASNRVERKALAGIPSEDLDAFFRVMSAITKNLLEM